jgi:transposase InsO family protein
VLDDFSRFIVAWKLCATMKAQDVTVALDLALFVYFGRAEAVLLERERIKRQTIANRRLQHHLHAA